MHDLDLLFLLIRDTYPGTLGTAEDARRTRPPVLILNAYTLQRWVHPN